MSTYVMSDLHGEYNMFQRMLEKIDFSDEDLLYIDGDILDRGPEPIELLLDLADRFNVELIAGNHELMAISCLKFLLAEVTESSIEELDANKLEMLMNWQANGADTTLAGLRKLSAQGKSDIFNCLMDCSSYDELTVGGRHFIITHAGLGGFSPDRELDDYSLAELVWTRTDYSKKYFDDAYLITGHTPTLIIEGNPRPGYIYSVNNHIAIDCGCTYEGGRLGCLRLNDLQEFYVERT